MAIRGGDGFDNYSDLTLKYTLVNTLAGTNMLIQSGSKRTGSAGLRFQPPTFQAISADHAVYIQEPYQTGLSTAIHGIAIRPTLFTLTAVDDAKTHGEFFSFVDGPNKQISFHLDASGKILVYDGNEVFLGATTRQLMLNIWRYVEVKVTFHGTFGSVDVRLDGNIALSLVNVNTKKTVAGNQATAYNIGKYFGFANNRNIIHMQCDFDDSVPVDASGVSNNNFIGDQAVKTDVPTSDSTPLNFTRGGTDSGASFSQVDEIPPNGDTDYIFSSTVGHISHFGFPAAVATTIKALIVNMVARKTDGSARSIRASCKSGATTGDSGVDLPLSTNYFMYQGIFENDPATGNPWTLANLNASVKGPKVSV